MNKKGRQAAEMKNRKRKWLLYFCIVGILSLSGCGSTTQENHVQSTGSVPIEEMKAEADIFAMDTYMKIIAYGAEADKAVEAAEQEVKRLDTLLSPESAYGEVGQINANGEGKCADDTAYLWERSLQLYEDTEGVFNVMLYPIIEAWGFITKEYTVPSEETLTELLPLTDMKKVAYDAEKKEIKFMQDGMKIGFGGIAKGYTSARIMEIFQDYDVESAMVNLGGNVQVKGKKTDGTDWGVAIRDPKNEENVLGVVQVADQAVITSGGYERYFEQNGITYHHILDPSTGKPAHHGLASVTIVSTDGTLADGLSTSLFVMGREKAEEYWKRNADKFQTILVTDDGELYITEGLADIFTSQEKEVHIIKK